MNLLIDIKLNTRCGLFTVQSRNGINKLLSNNKLTQEQEMIQVSDARRKKKKKRKGSG